MKLPNKFLFTLLTISHLCVAPCLCQASGASKEGNAQVETKPDRIVIKTQLAVGLVFSPTDRREFFASPKLDAAGKQEFRDGQGVYIVRQRDTEISTGTQVSGAVSVIFRQDFSHTGGLAGQLLRPLTGVGFSLGTGFSATSGGTSLSAPFIGASLFFGKDHDVVVTIGPMAVPSKRLRDYRVGQEILGNAINQDDTNRAGWFISVLYHVAGSGK